MNKLLMVSLKDFQKKCAENKKLKDEAEFEKLRLKEEEEQVDAKRMEEWNIMMDAQERFGDDYKPISVLGGLKKPKCPCCQDNLEKNILKYDGVFEYQIVYCLNCGYRFARAMRS